MRERAPGVVAIVLAAGIGARLGGPKALLRVGPGEGMPLVEAQCRDRLEAESARAIAVVRADVAALVGDRLRAAGAEVVVSCAADGDGPAGSLAAAAAYLADEAIRAAIVTPVDVRVRAATVRALVDALIEVEPPNEAEGAALFARRTNNVEDCVRSAADSAPPSGAPPPRNGLRPPSEGTKKARGAPYEEGAPPLAIVPLFEGRRGHPVVLGARALARYREDGPPPLRDHLRALGEGVAVLDVDDAWILEDLDFAHQRETLVRFTGAPTPTFLR